MSSSGQSSQNRASEDALLLSGILLAFVGVFLFAAWWFFHPQIAQAVMTLQHAMMVFASRFTDNYLSLDAQVMATDPASVRITALWRLVHNVGLFYRFPSAAIISLLAVLCLVWNAPSRFTGVLDLAGLMRTQARVFRTPAAFVRRPLRLERLAGGAPRPSDPALHLVEWVDRYARDPAGHYSEHRAAGELGLQLGAPWSGVASAAPHVRALLAVFALHTARERERATGLLGDLSESLPDGRGDKPWGPDAALSLSLAAVAEADAILADPVLLAPCLLVANRHAFTAPALMSVLTLAREKAGVLAPAQFAFLKLVDRRLWYALHSLGFPGGQNRAEQPNPRVEAVGVRDHWAAECDVGRPLSDPSFDRAFAVIRKSALFQTTTEKPS